MPTPGRLAICMGGLLLVGAAVTTVGGEQEDPFPHADHAGLFPVCTGCHGGIGEENPAASYPEPELCARCHDGVQEGLVSWEAPSRSPSNVVFDHVVHASELDQAGDPAQSCEACHSASAERPITSLSASEVGLFALVHRMDVTATEELQTCWGCHAHETEDHFFVASAACETCHVPLAETTFGLARIESLPMPAIHEDPLFLPELHGILATDHADRCATCHTADRCLTCHVDGDLVSLERAGIQLAPGGDSLMTPPRRDPARAQDDDPRAGKRSERRNFKPQPEDDERRDRTQEKRAVESRPRGFHATPVRNQPGPERRGARRRRP